MDIPKRRLKYVNEQKQSSEARNQQLSKRKTSRKKPNRKVKFSSDDKSLPNDKSSSNNNKSSSNDKREIFVIDTNIILNDHMAPFSISKAEICIPQVVINELDKKQDFAHSKSVAYNARAFGRKLRGLLRKQQSSTLKLDNGSTLRLLRTSKDANKTIEQLGLEPRKADSYIVAAAWELKNAGHDVTLLSNDNNMFISAIALDIKVDDYGADSAPKKTEPFTGVKVIEFEDGELIQQFYEGKKCMLREDKHPGLHMNQIIVLKHTYGESSTSILSCFKGYDRPLRRIHYSGKPGELRFSGIEPLNKEQAFALHLLSDDKITCVTLAGKAGTGKSIVTLGYAIENLGKRSASGYSYEKILILKPVVPIGKDIGYLPGTIDEKLEPWMKSFADSLDIIFKGDGKVEKDNKAFKERPYKYMMEAGILQFQPLTFMRGRSLQNTLVILDECQNCSVSEVKTLLTRIGHGSKVVCLGDVDQIDTPFLDKYSNGLTYLINRGKDAPMIGHITLIKSQRSDLAEWAADNL